MDDPDEIPELSKRSTGSGRWIMVLGITLPLAVGAGVVLGTSLFGGKNANCPPAAIAPKPSAEPAPSAAPPPTLIEKATAGDFATIDELKARPAAQRSAAETLALARGRSHNKVAALEGFGKEIAKDPTVLSNKDQLARLKDFLNKGETTNDAAALIVDLPGTLGPDLLYEVVSTPKGRPDIAQLADDLLATKEVREKASPALALTLDLHAAATCDDFKALLPKAAEVGDRRAIPALAKLTSKKGCGDTKRDDCFECLRPLEKDKDAIDLVDAIKAAQKRPIPKL